MWNYPETEVETTYLVEFSSIVSPIKENYSYEQSNIVDNYLRFSHSLTDCIQLEQSCPCFFVPLDDNDRLILFFFPLLNQRKRENSSLPFFLFVARVFFNFFESQI